MPKHRKTSPRRKTTPREDRLLPWFSDDEHTRGVQFENFLRWWLIAGSVLSTSAYRLVKVLRWEDWPDRPDIDLGTDLVGWDEEGRLWAIQGKAYAPDRLVTKSEIAQLVADAKTGRGGPFFGRIYVTASDGYTKNAKTIAKRNGVLLLSRADLTDTGDTLPWPKSETQLRALLSGKKSGRRTMKPRRHQKKAIGAAVKHLTNAERGQLVMACGTGKTLTALRIKEGLLHGPADRREPARTLVLVPSLHLLAQNLQEWAANRETDWKRLAVCSDRTVGAARDDNFEDMKAVDAGFDVTTNRSEIRAFLRETAGEQVVFSTYQSSFEVAAAARAEGIEFDLVICDEAHNLAGRGGKTYSGVLDAQKFPVRRRLFMTATPKIVTPNAKRRAGEAGYTVTSMDDPEKFGEVFHRLSFGEAIRRKLLTDYRVVIAVTTDAEARELLEENRFVDVDGKALCAADLAAAIVVGKAARRYKVRRIVSFHSTIERSKRFVNTLTAISRERVPGLPAKVSADHVDGTFPASERRRRLERLRDAERGLALLANANCLTEGVDTPAIDGIAFVDPRQSVVDIIQAIGRAIRLAADKKMGTIIIPVVCDAEGSAETVIDAAGYRKIRQVLWALRAHDEELAAEIDEFVFAVARPDGRRISSMLPEKLSIDFDGDDLETFADGIRVGVLKAGSPDADWAQRYADIKAFRAKHERWPAKRASGEEGFMATWVSNQRTAWKNGKLSPERVKRLEALKGWSWDPFADTWNHTFKAVQAFLEKHDRWPAQGASGDEGVVASWIQTQRQARKKGTLSAERVKRLETLPGWSWDVLVYAWDQSFEAVQAFRTKHNRWPVGTASGEESVMATWISTQRQAWKNGKLSTERVKRLEALPGWSWDPLAEAWDQNFKAVQELQAKHKRWPSKKASKVERAMAAWIGKQRKAWKNGKLSPGRSARLETLPGWRW